MPQTVIGLFDSPEATERLVRDLENSGFSPNEISIVAMNAEVEAIPSASLEEQEEIAALVGAGAAVGGLTSLSLGLTPVALPGIGPAVTAGPLASRLTAAPTSESAGGLLGALREVGVSEREAELFSEGVRRGEVLVGVNASNRADAAAYLMDGHGAIDIERYSAYVTEVAAETGAGEDASRGTGRARSEGGGARIYYE